MRKLQDFSSFRRKHIFWPSGTEKQGKKTEKLHNNVPQGESGENG